MSHVQELCLLRIWIRHCVHLAYTKCMFHSGWHFWSSSCKCMRWILLILPRSRREKDTTLDIHHGNKKISCLIQMFWRPYTAISHINHADSSCRRNAYRIPRKKFMFISKLFIRKCKFFTRQGRCLAGVQNHHEYFVLRISCAFLSSLPLPKKKQTHKHIKYAWIHFGMAHIGEKYKQQYFILYFAVNAPPATQYQTCAR